MQAQYTRSQSTWFLLFASAATDCADDAAGASVGLAAVMIASAGHEASTAVAHV